MPRSRIASSACARRSAVSIAGYSAALDTVAVQPGVHLDGDGRGAAGALDRVEQLTELAHRGQRKLDIGLQRGGEVGAGRVQPGQHRGGDAVAAQRQRLVDGGDAEFGRAGGQRGAADLGGAVAVPVGLDDGHHLRRAGMLPQQPHVVGDRVEVHHRLGGRGRRQAVSSVVCMVMSPPPIVPERAPTDLCRDSRSAQVSSPD